MRRPMPLPPGPARVDVEACEFASNASSPHVQRWNRAWLHSHHNWTDRIVLQDGLHTVELEDRTFIDEQGQRVKWLMTIKQGASVLASGIEMQEYEVSP